MNIIKGDISTPHILPLKNSSHDYDSVLKAYVNTLDLALNYK